MKSYDELFRENAELPPEAFQELRAGFITAFRDSLVGRQIMPIRNLPASAQSFAYDRIKTEPNKAAFVGKGAIFPVDDFDLERKTLPVPKLGWAFKIPREDFLAGQIQNQQVDYARRRGAEAEDLLIFTGDDDFGYLGLLDVYNNTRVAGGGSPLAWDNASKTVVQMYDDVRTLIALMQADKVQGPYTMVVHPDEMASMGLFDTTSQRTAQELIERLVGSILESYTLTTTNVAVMRTGPDIAQLGVAEDLTLDVPLYDADRQEYRGRAYERLIPIFYQYGTTSNKSDAIGVITGC